MRDMLFERVGKKSGSDRDGSMIDIVVRPAVLSDLDILYEFEQAIIEAERPFDPAIRTDENVHYYDLPALIASPDTELVVAKVDGRIVGCGYARIESSKSYLRHRGHSYLGFMYVTPPLRGKGVNKMILKALEAWSAARGITDFKLEVYIDNVAAIRAYEKAGYSGIVLEMQKRIAKS